MIILRKFIIIFILVSPYFSLNWAAEKLQDRETKTVVDFSVDGGSGKVPALASAPWVLEKKQNWEGFQKLHLEVINPLTESLIIRIEIRDKESRDYWTRVNLEVLVPPGRNTVSLPTQLFVGEKSRPGRKLLLNQITYFSIDALGKNLQLQKIHLAKSSGNKYAFSGLWAFDFGPKNSQVMESFIPVSEETPYNVNQRYGWKNPNFWKSFDVLQPDPLYQDFICLKNGVWAMDLPNGQYHIVMNLDAQNGYWGEVQSFKDRKVWANGKLKIHEKMNFSDFLVKYFRNSSREDLPGIDPFDDYVEKSYQLKEFDVDIQNGKLELNFLSEGFGISLSSLVVFPQNRIREGRLFLKEVTEQRRQFFRNSFKMIPPPKNGADPFEDSYRIFAHDEMRTIYPNDGPMVEDRELSTEVGWSVAMTTDQEYPITFSIQPGKKSSPLGSLSISIRDLKSKPKINSQSKKLSLLKKYLQIGWIDYRLQRKNNEGSIYSIAPRYWHPLPAPMPAGITRTLWIRAKFPPTIEPGDYAGTLDIRPASGSPKSFPLTLTILPLSLRPIDDIAVGPFGSRMELPVLDLETSSETKKSAWEWKLFEKSLDVLSEGGLTTFSGIPHLKFHATEGKIILETELADREMKIIRAKGFKNILSSYGVDLGYLMKGDESGADEKFAQSHGFKTRSDFIARLYQTIDKHSLEKNWLPVAWNILDEPLDSEIPAALKNLEAHHKIVSQLQKNTFMGETSQNENAISFEKYKLFKFLPIVALHNHNTESIRAIQQTSNLFAFYNDSSRWTLGFYMKMLVKRYHLKMRLLWHFNNNMGDPYFPLDSREDDINWFNTDNSQVIIPSLHYLQHIQTGLADYRLLSTLEYLIDQKPHHSMGTRAKQILDELLRGDPGKDQHEPLSSYEYKKLRSRLLEGINLLTSTSLPNEDRHGN